VSSSRFLEANDLWFAYDDSRPVLRGISLAIPRGAFVAILGQNGSGKTTFAKHFNGLLRPMRGQILLDGGDIRDRSIGELAKTVGYVFQNPDQQIFSATVFEEVAFGPRNLGFDAMHVPQQVQEALKLFGLESLASHSPATLGFGLRRKVTLAAVYSMQTPVLILDEPSTALDWQSTVGLMEILTRLHREGRTILLITHDMRIVADYVPHSIVLNDGELVAYDTTRAIFQQPERLASTNLELPQVTRLAQSLEPYGMPNGILTVNEFCDAYERRVAPRP
jgi:energy-coupling factor transporter ATP-binding protein EcfA2